MAVYLRDRITAALTAAGFKARDDYVPAYATGGTFALVTGVGVRIGAEWWSACPLERAGLLGRFAVALCAAGFTVEDRGEFLYIDDPSRYGLHPTLSEGTLIGVSDTSTGGNTMGQQLTRDDGDSLDQDRPATYISDRGWQYRMLPAGEIAGAWRIWADANDALRWMSPLSWDHYIAVPQIDPTYGYCFGYEIRRVCRRDTARQTVIGYAMNLADMCWPVEDDLVFTMDYPARKAAAA